MQSDRQYFPATDISAPSAPKDVLVLHWFPPTYQQAYPAGTAGYFGAPTATNCFALCLAQDNTLYIQTIENLIAKIY